MVVILTFANQKTPGLHNWEATMRKFGHDGVVIGMGRKWNGFMTKIQGYQEYISGLPSETIVTITDAFDVMACRPAKGLLEAYLQFQKPLVVSTENICVKSLNCQPVETWWRQTLQPRNRYRYVILVL